MAKPPEGVVCIGGRSGLRYFPLPVRVGVPLTCGRLENDRDLVAVPRQGLTKVGVVAHRSQPTTGAHVVGNYTADEVFEIASDQSRKEAPSKLREVVRSREPS